MNYKEVWNDFKGELRTAIDIIFGNEKRAKILFLSAIFLLVILSIMPANTTVQGIVAWGLVVLISLLFGRQEEIVRYFILFCGIFVSLRYFTWRTFYTINTEDPLNFIASFSLYLAELYGILVYILGVFVSIKPLERETVPLPEDSSKLPTVDIFIPTYNEPPEIVRITAIAAASMDYPADKFKVYILDDGGTEEKLNDPSPEKRKANRKRAEELKKIAKEIPNVYYLTRKKNVHAKAGNINEALKKTNGDLILILDCDHIPSRDFLKNTVGWFIKRPKLFLLQTPHFFYNPDPIEKNLDMFREVPSENEMFYKYIQKGLDFWESSFFCGSAALLRRKYLNEIGGISGETVTEDAETALELHSRGYESAYIDKPMIFGLNPETYSAFVIQRIRWSQGMVQIFLLKNPLLRKGLKWYQKLGYFNSSFFWFFSFSRVIFLIAPLLYLIFGMRIYMANLQEVLSYAFPHFFASVLVSNYLYGRVRWNFFSEIYELVQSVYTLPAILKVFLNPRKPKFGVTPKGENLVKDFVSPFYKPFFILFHLNILSYIFAVYRWINFVDERGTIVVTVYWNLLNTIFLMAALVIVRERRQLRRFYRIPVKDEAVVVGPKKESYFAKVEDISLGGVKLKLFEKSNLKDGDRIDIIFYTVMDEREVLKAEIVNVRRGYLHCKFVIDTHEDLAKVVRIIYGSSVRWEHFKEVDHRTPWGALLYILKKTLKYFPESYKMEWREFLRSLPKGA